MFLTQDPWTCYFPLSEVLVHPRIHMASSPPSTKSFTYKSPVQEYLPIQTVNTLYSHIFLFVSLFFSLL